jgi:5-(carboxyamino)imidazole ribonucleotide synthase
MLPERRKIGVIGGGQLGKMLIESSRPWNIEYIVLENAIDCPASMLAEVICGSLQSPDKIRELAQKVDVLTFEIEHVHVETLLELEKEGKLIIPSPKVLQIIQDKGIQKEFYKQHNIPTANFVNVIDHSALLDCFHRFSGEQIVIKSRLGGYDGKGVQIVNKLDILDGNFQLMDASVIEQFQADMLEISVIVARDQNGDTVTYDPIEMYFNPQSNLVEFLFSPANISPEISDKCREIALHAIKALDGVGIYAVELFVTKSGEVMVNEIAPRPHNSGHHTIEGAITSQFEQLNRILLGLPLGNTEMICPSAMINLVGPAKLEGDFQLEHTFSLLNTQGVYIHLYNKKTIKPHRKMGHITILAKDFTDLIDKAEYVKAHLGFVKA